MKSPVLLLGGGQLGLMMAEAGARLAIQVDRLDLADEQLIPGTSGLHVPATADQLIERYPVISAELEHLPDTDLVNGLRQSPNWANRKAFELIADRRQEKSLLDRLGVATADWRFIDSRAALDQAFAELGPLVVKVTLGGYDGRGQWVLTSTTDAVPDSYFGRLIAESRINFNREVSLIAARSKTGRILFYPLTENVHYQGILRYSIANLTPDPALQSQGESMLRTILEDLDYVGVMAMECFVTEQGLLVNELAPRVHNSGHWTQLGAEQNQFDLHLHTLLDLPLLEEQNYRPTLMLNLIGCEFDPAWLEISGLQCHWYGKSLREGRKMGHINIDISNPDNRVKATKQLMQHLDTEHQTMLSEALHRVDD